MEPILRCFGLLLKVVAFFVMPLVRLYNHVHYAPIRIPAPDDDLLQLAAVDLAAKICNREVTAVAAVRAYVTRIRLVDPLLNAVVEDRFEAALVEAGRMDATIAASGVRPLELLQRYPLCGVPFTVKESCSLKGLSYSVGSVQRRGIRATADGAAVANLRAAGAIPLLVSNTPEFCTSWESNNLLRGRTLNPHDARCTAGGSSGGEGALIGAGASLFGVASDVAGSIRIPAMFNGVFGHKPTGGVISLEGHFPMSTDPMLGEYLTVGPICRYAKDLATVVSVMAGPEGTARLRLNEECMTKDIRVFYMEDAGWSLVDVPVQPEIKLYMQRAVEHFKRNGLKTKRAPLKSLQQSLETSIATFFTMTDIPYILRHPEEPSTCDSLPVELAKSMVGRSQYSFAGLFFATLIRTGGFIPASRVPAYVQKNDELRKRLLAMLGDDGVLFYPTYPVSAVQHNESFVRVLGVMYTMVFNVLGFPSTHVPMGRDLNGRPVGMQVVAAPYQDRLCLCMAGELEAAFGGWVKPF